MTLDAKYFDKSLATALAKKRQRARDSGKRLIFDCRFAQVIDSRVSCKCVTLPHGGLFILTVLSGKSAGSCHRCPCYEYFEEGEE